MREDIDTRAHRAWIAWLEARIQHWRERNDSPALDERETALIRGRIRELTDLLTLALPPQHDSAPPDEAGAWGRKAV